MNVSSDSTVAKMSPDPMRILGAICYVIGQADKKRYQATQYDIVKTLFLADRQHLNEWGRPITYDNYVAMLHGPVPSLSYSFLKEDAFAVAKHDVVLPWSRHQLEGGKFHYTGCVDGGAMDHLSDSDKEALDVAFDIVRKYSFSQVRRLTHEDAAYIDAWREDEEKKAFDMNLALMFEEPNNDRAEYLSEMSQFVRAG